MSSTVTADFKATLRLLGIQQQQVAREARMSEGYLSRIVRNPSAHPTAMGHLRRVARALMLLALRAGLNDDEVWELNEQQLFGLPGELDRERVMAEVKAKAGEVR